MAIRKVSLREFNFTFFPISAQEKRVEIPFRFFDFNWKKNALNCSRERNLIKEKLHNWAIKWKDNKRRKSCLMTLEEMNDFARSEWEN